MSNKTWNLIRIANKKYLGMDPHLSDLIAVEPVISLCALGLSNQSIQYRLEMDLDYIASVIMSFLDFSGWEYDLDFSPFTVYELTDGDYLRYKEAIEIATPSDHQFIHQSFMVCIAYSEIKGEIDSYYDK